MAPGAEPEATIAVPYELPTLEAPEPREPVGEPFEGPADAVMSALGSAVAEAHAQAEAIRAAAWEAGRAEGLEIGRAEALAHARGAAEALAAAAAALDVVREKAAEHAEAAAVELALRIAEKIVAGALSVQPERVLDVVRGALRCLTARERVQVLVHPDDLGIVREAVEGLAGELGGIQHMEVLQERRVARGDAIVKTVEAEVDARLATKLDRVRAALEEEPAP